MWFRTKRITVWWWTMSCTSWAVRLRMQTRLFSIIVASSNPVHKRQSRSIKAPEVAFSFLRRNSNKKLARSPSLARPLTTLKVSVPLKDHLVTINLSIASQESSRTKSDSSKTLTMVSVLPCKASLRIGATQRPNTATQTLPGTIFCNSKLR